MSELSREIVGSWAWSHGFRVNGVSIRLATVLNLFRSFSLESLIKNVVLAWAWNFPFERLEPFAVLAWQFAHSSEVRKDVLP